jgi:hypothetical protein
LQLYVALYEAMLRGRLQQAERHVREGRLHVQRQRAVIRRLEQGGYDSRDARFLLGTIEELLCLHIRERDALVREIADWIAER